MPAPWSTRASVEAAIRGAGGNLTRAAAALGCSRQTLYSSIYRHGLERLAGVDLERGDEVNRLRTAEPGAEPIPVTVKLPPELWKRIRVRAIESDTTASEVVRTMLEAGLDRKA
jgi:hypothetical protein